jgi:hypothetical protein
LALLPQLEAGDKAAIHGLVAAFFGAFSAQPNGKVDLSVLRTLFIPEGVIIKACDPVPEVYTLQQFLEPRERMLNDGTLTDFREEEISERTDLFGNMACRLSTYRKSWKSSGQAFAAKGMKAIHFVRTSEGWKMSALIWDDEREGVRLPGEQARLG